jgi:hypothetical protein
MAQVGVTLKFYPQNSKCVLRRGPCACGDQKIGHAHDTQDQDPRPIIRNFTVPYPPLLYRGYTCYRRITVYRSRDRRGGLGFCHFGYIRNRRYGISMWMSDARPQAPSAYYVSEPHSRRPEASQLSSTASGLKTLLTTCCGLRTVSRLCPQDCLARSSARDLTTTPPGYHV